MPSAPGGVAGLKGPGGALGVGVGGAREQGHSRDFQSGHAHELSMVIGTS